MTRPATRTVRRVDFRTTTSPLPKEAPVLRVPWVTRLLALAHEIDRQVRNGELRDLAEAARALNLTRARVTQIANLLLLAPEIQETILNLPLVTSGRDLVNERQLRPIAAEPDWQRQIQMWGQEHG